MTTVLTRAVSRGLLAPTLVVAAAILVKGYAEVGDGFAAGLVASLGILVQILAFGRDAVAAVLPLHRAPLLALAGVGTGVAVLAGGLLFGDPPFRHAPGPGEDVVAIGTLELITPMLFDVGVCALVVGAVVGMIDALATAGAGRKDGAS